MNNHLDIGGVGEGFCKCGQHGLEVGGGEDVNFARSGLGLGMGRSEEQTEKGGEQAKAECRGPSTAPSTPLRQARGRSGFGRDDGAYVGARRILGQICLHAIG